MRTVGPPTLLRVASAIAIALSLVVVVSSAESTPSLRSFYIASRASFGISSDDIVSVEPVGQDSRVRAMRVVSVNVACPQVRVAQAAGRVVRQATVQTIARLPICDMTQQRIDRALAQSKTPRVSYIDYMGGGKTVVADCGGKQHLLELRDEAPWVNFETLRRRDRAVSDLWDLSGRLAQGMLPDDAQAPTPDVESLGVTLLPEFRSPKYFPVFGDALVTALKDYTAPPVQRAPVPEVLERETLPLAAFVAPTYPPIALSARMAGDVRLRLTVDAASGTVAEVERVLDKPILGDAAVEAVRHWRFDPARAPRQPIDVTVRFQLRCGP